MTGSARRQSLAYSSIFRIRSNGTALVDSYADWCGPCRMVSPIVDEFAERHIEGAILIPDYEFGSLRLYEY